MFYPSRVNVPYIAFYLHIRVHTRHQFHVGAHLLDMLGPWLAAFEIYDGNVVSRENDTVWSSDFRLSAHRICGNDAAFIVHLVVW